MPGHRYGLEVDGKLQLGRVEALDSPPIQDGRGPVELVMVALGLVPHVWVVRVQ